ncbi:MAG: hypothetical protein GY861_08940 [bacterium]|nr:hypothetical protein [bacterium]
MTEKNDDEISIDFGKIGGFFKKKKEHITIKDTDEEKISVDVEEKKDEKEVTIDVQKKDEGEEIKVDVKKKEDDEEISVDFKKIGGFFNKLSKGDGKEAEKKVSDDDDVPFDFSGTIKGVKTFFKDGKTKETGFASKVVKNTGLIIGLIGLIFAICLAVDVRMAPADAYYTQQWAESSVHNTVLADIEGAINSKYPNLPDDKKGQLVGDEFNRVRKEGTYIFKGGPYAGQNVNIDDQIEDTADHFRSYFEDENDDMYMPDIDPYYWYRYAKNVQEKGGVGDEVKDGDQWDNHQVAPLGRGIGAMDLFHPYFLAYFDNFINFFNPNLDLIRTMMFYSIVISALSIIPIFFIARRIGGNVAAVFAAIMAAISVSFVTRTLFGHADSDAWVIFFPVYITWLFLEAFEAKKTIYQAILGAASGLLVGLFSLAWGGWWYIFDFLLAATVIYGAYHIATHFTDLKEGISYFLKNPLMKQILVVGVTFLISSLFFVSIISGPEHISTPLNSLGFTSIKDPVLPSLWPNVLTTVAELNPGSINQIIGSMGGGFIFWIALIGIALATMRFKKEGIPDVLFILGSAAWWVALLVFFELINDTVLRTILFIMFVLVAGAILFFSLKKEDGKDILNIITSFAITGAWIGIAALLFIVDTTALFLLLLIIPIFGWFSWAIIVQDRNINVKLAVLLIIWFIGTVYASTKGIRFTLMLVPAFSIAFGAFAGIIYKYVSRGIPKLLQINDIIVKVFIIAILVTLFFVPHNIAEGSYGTARQDVPIINDAWYNSLTKIKMESQEDAIITSWWDFGHHFKALADRPVTFDGTTQQFPQAHWVGKILTEGDEKMAIGMLRMLDCGAHDAYNKLDRVKKDTVESVNILYDIVVMEREDAKNTLMDNGLNEEEAESVLEDTHCDPPEGFFVTSEDMIGKSGVWAHFGEWDFEKADLIHNAKDLNVDDAVAYMKARYDYTDERARQIYYDMNALESDRAENDWVSPWPSYSSGPDGCAQNGEIVQCNNGLIVNITDMNAWFNTQEGQKNPVSIVYADEEGIHEKMFDDNYVGDVSAVLIPDGNGFVSLLSSPQIAGGMFTQLFFMDGHGLEHFKLFSHERSITGWNIYVWKVDWDGGEKNVMPEFVEDVQAGKSVTTNYIGYFENGTLFDSSIAGWQELDVTKDSLFDDFETRPFSFTAGQMQVIQGFDEAAMGMLVGDEKVFEVTPEKGYGFEGHPLSNHTLFFKIRVEAIE